MSGQYCFGGWSGFIGRQCSITGAWVSPPNGTCTRKIGIHTRTRANITEFGRVADMHAVHVATRTEIFCPARDSGSIDGYAAWPLTAAGASPKNVTSTACDETYGGAPWRQCNSDGSWSAVTNPCQRTYSRSNRHWCVRGSLVQRAGRVCVHVCQ